MKWGVRRYQKKDGSLTNAGKKRYANDSSVKKEKSNHRLRLEKQYREKGLSSADAKAAADKRIKIEKAVAVTAGMTLAACTAYYVRNKYLADRCDQILKKGTSFHNLDAVANPRPGEHLYVNYRQNDKNFFRGQFALGKIKRSGTVYDHVVTANEDIKIPSLKTRKSVFKELFNKDDEFRKTFNEHAGIPKDNKSSWATYKMMWQKMGDKNNPDFNKVKHKYFEALRQKGYDAIVDEWDTNKRVYRSDAPLILLNTSSKSLGNMSIKELTGKDVLISQANSRHYARGRSLLNSMSLPHANSFKESERQLARYAKKNAKNTEYINKILSKAPNIDAKSEALKMRGSILADAGKYITKNEKLSVDKALKMATAKDKGQRFVTDMGTVTLGTIAPMYTYSTVKRNVAVEKYIAEHPNTKLTVKEIEKMYKKNQGKL